MSRMRIAIHLMTLLAAVAGAQDPQPPRDVVPVAGTYYFYWYKHPGEHFVNPDGSDALSQHFDDPARVDYEDSAWHRRQVEWMMEAGLDFFLPVYWPGAPFADVGLDALVEAVGQIVAVGGSPPKIGMFYDTTPLLRARDGRLDLRTEEGAEEFAGAVLRFFDRIPAGLRLELDGFPVLVVYSSFGAPHDRDIFDRVGRRFQRRFGKRLFVVAEQSWNARAHARYRWGSALTGPTGDSVVKTLGPGYDDTPVPDRGTPIRHREETRFYRWSWNQVLLGNPTVVLIETWNEFHEGTGIAPCREFGRTYVDLTRRYVARLKARLLPDPERPVRLAHPDPLPRPDTGWWKGGDGAAAAVFDAAEAAGPLGAGLRLAQVPDGPYERETLGEQAFVKTPAPGAGVTYLYFGIADELAHRTAAPYEVELEVIDGGDGALRLQYDSWDVNASHDGAYKDAPRHRRGGPLERRRLVYRLPDARFSNRQNGGSDFRVAITGEELRVAAVRVRPADAKGSDAPTLRGD